MTYKATLLLLAGMTVAVLSGTTGGYWLFTGLLIVVALVRMGLR